MLTLSLGINHLSLFLSKGLKHYPMQLSQNFAEIALKKDHFGVDLCEINQHIDDGLPLR